MSVWSQHRIKNNHKLFVRLLFVSLFFVFVSIGVVDVVAAAAGIVVSA